ncbi:hypothetical protein FSP39_012617 [Pinctada imbricata]|uniref:Transmembrane protein 45B n=1 Tax=Pinctada imbricata TaxID=66713 RepID=A0AA88YD20_PINIB|nr:hypothetical protein FSP39_012617 [Pinctada imbricata]
MGSFGGHVLAGSFFIFFAIWWTVQMFHRHLISLRRKIPFRSTVTYPCTCLCGKLQEWPIEGFLKFAFTFLGGLLEVITGTSNGKFVVLVNGQHATSYFFYALSGLFDLLMYYRVSWIPDDLDWIISLVAVGVEGLLLYFHLHGRSILDVHIHMLLVYTILLNILAICFEIRFRHSLLAALGRAYFFFLQGTWLWQIAFIIYDPDPNAEKWKGDDHDELMIATMFFAWHVGAVLFVMLAIGAAVSYFHQRQKGIRNEEAESKHLKKLHYDGQFLNSDDDTESDIEFQTLITK